MVVYHAANAVAFFDTCIASLDNLRSLLSLYPRFLLLAVMSCSSCPPKSPEGQSVLKQLETHDSKQMHHYDVNPNPRHGKFRTSSCKTWTTSNATSIIRTKLLDYLLVLLIHGIDGEGATRLWQNVSHHYPCPQSNPAPFLCYWATPRDGVGYAASPRGVLLSAIRAARVFSGCSYLLPHMQIIKLIKLSRLRNRGAPMTQPYAVTILSVTRKLPGH